MKITVWSALSGKVSGHLVVNVPPTYTVRKLLETYCSQKGVQPKGYVMRSRDNLLLNPDKSLESLRVGDGDTLTLGLSDDEDLTFGFGSWWMVTFTALLIGVIGLTAIIWVYIEPLSIPIKYGIVMDAGSSHSQIYVYSWNGEKPMDTARVTLAHSCMMSGGVASFVDHVDDLSKYLEKCLDETKKNVPTASQMTTPFYVGATAGMRILRDSDPEGAELILATIENALCKTPFLINHDNIAILEGSEEGADGWIAVNYLLGHLENNQEPTAAALDVGGASVQVSSVVEDKWTEAPENLTLFKNNYPVVSQTFMCYGLSEAEHRYLYLLVNDNRTIIENETYIDPCLAKGVVHKLTKDDLNGHCTLTDGSKPVLTVSSHLRLDKFITMFEDTESNETEHDYFLKAYDKKIMKRSQDSDEDNMVIRGSSNPSLCERNVGKLFDLKLCQGTFTYGDCMSSELIPPITGEFVGFSSIFKKAKKVLGLKSGSSLEDFKASTFELCSLSADDLYKKYPYFRKAKAENLCFHTMYLLNLLTAGLGVNNTNWKYMNFNNTINNTAVEWSMGYMINKTTAMPAVNPQETLSLPVFSLLVLLFGAFIISGFIFLWHSIKIKKQSTSYQRVIADHIDQELHKFI